MNKYYDANDREVDKVFVSEYIKGRKGGLSISDAMESAHGSALSRIITIRERK